MSEIIKEFRKKYPEYKDRGDEELKRAIYEKFYREQRGITFEEFEERFDKAPRSKADDLRDSLVSGALQGASETVDFGGNMANRIMNLPLQITQKLGLMELFQPAVKSTTGIDIGTSDDIQIPQRDPNAKTVRQTVADLTDGYSEYQPQTFEGEYAQTLGQFGGGSLTMPLGGPLRSLVASIIPALGSETAGQLTQGTEYENIARFAGALGLPVAQALATPALRRLARGNPDDILANLSGSQRAQSVDLLRREGVDNISAGQQIGSPNLMMLEGAENASLLSKQQLTQAALRQAGTNAELATPDVMNQTRLRIGKVFDTVDNLAGGVPKAQEVNDMIRAVQKAQGDMNFGDVPRNLEKIVKGFRDAAKDGTTISSKRISQIRTDLNDAMSRYAKANEMINYDLAFEIKEALDNIVARQIPRQLLPSLDNARDQYRAYLTIERGMSGGGAEVASGLLSAERLSNAVRNREGKSYVKGTGSDLADIARASQEVLTALPAVSAGGKRVEDNLFNFARDIVPSTYARFAQETLPLNTRQAVFPSLFERVARQTGGLLNID